jgi:hypothetical protein
VAEPSDPLLIRAKAARELIADGLLDPVDGLRQVVWPDAKLAAFYGASSIHGAAEAAEGNSHGDKWQDVLFDLRDRPEVPVGALQVDDLAAPCSVVVDVDEEPVLNAPNLRARCCPSS